MRPTDEYMGGSRYISLRLKAKQFEHIQRVRVGIEQQIERFGQDGFPPEFYPWADGAIKHLRFIETGLTREIAALMSGTTMATWVDDTHGLGSAIYFVLGLLPPLAPIGGIDLTPFANPAKLWRYCGLHPEGGQRRTHGVKTGFSSRLKAYAIMRLAVPCEKLRGSPYRAIYDARRTATLASHPDMLARGAGCATCDLAWGKTAQHRGEHTYERERVGPSMDCFSLGGPHWRPAHRRADALRIVAKAILVDAWRVANGMPPRVRATTILPPNKPAPVPTVEAA